MTPRQSVALTVAAFVAFLFAAFVMPSPVLDPSSSRPAPVTRSDTPGPTPEPSSTGPLRSVDMSPTVQPGVQAEATIAGTLSPKPSRAPTARPSATKRPRQISRASQAPRPAPTRRPTRTLGNGTAGVAGLATWYCKPGSSPCTRGYPAGGHYAAAGPALRVGNWRGRVVTVEWKGNATTVTLIDWCACPGGRIVDLYSQVWTDLAAPLSLGGINVRVTW